MTAERSNVPPDAQRRLALGLCVTAPLILVALIATGEWPFLARLALVVAVAVAGSLAVTLFTRSSASRT